VHWYRLSKLAQPPSKATAGSAGYDLKSTRKYVVAPGERVLVKTDLAFCLPVGHYGRLCSRSGLAYNSSIDVAAGVIDRDYEVRYVPFVGIFLHTFLWPSSIIFFIVSLSLEGQCRRSDCQQRSPFFYGGTRNEDRTAGNPTVCGGCRALRNTRGARRPLPRHSAESEARCLGFWF
jgi:hypothetical protein